MCEAYPFPNDTLFRTQTNIFHAFHCPALNKTFALRICIQLLLLLEIICHAPTTWLNSLFIWPISTNGVGLLLCWQDIYTVISLKKFRHFEIEANVNKRLFICERINRPEWKWDVLSHKKKRGLCFMRLWFKGVKSMAMKWSDDKRGMLECELIVIIWLFTKLSDFGSNWVK